MNQKLIVHKKFETLSNGVPISDSDVKKSLLHHSLNSEVRISKSFLLCDRHKRQMLQAAIRKEFEPVSVTITKYTYSWKEVVSNRVMPKKNMLMFLKRLTSRTEDHKPVCFRIMYDTARSERYYCINITSKFHFNLKLCTVRQLK